MDSDLVTTGPVVIGEGTRDRLALLLNRIAGEIGERGETALAPLGLEGREYAVLALLATDKPESQQELARLMGKAPALIVACVDGLEEKGLVERRRSTEDRRRSVVVMTEAGRRTLTRADKIADEFVADLLAGLSPAQLDSLHKTLRNAIG